MCVSYVIQIFPLLKVSLKNHTKGIKKGPEVGNYCSWKLCFTRFKKLNNSKNFSCYLLQILKPFQIKN